MAEKSLSKNALFNVIYKCLNVLFPLVTMMYVSRILLPEGIGKVASAQNIVSYFVIIASLGLPTYGTKVIAECRDDREKCNKVFTELFSINAISTLLCSLVYIGMLFSIDFFRPKITITLIAGIQLFANIINIDWLYQGFEEYQYIMLRSIIVKLVAFATVFIFIHEPSDYLIYALISALSLVANFVFNISHMHKFVNISFHNLCLKKHLKPILTLLAASISIELYTLFATTLLSVFKGDAIVAYYTNSAKAVALTRTLITSVCAVFLPRLNYYIGHNRITDFKNLAEKGLYLLLSLSVPATILLAILADNCVLILFGDAYTPSILSMQILSISIITVAISNFTGYQILVSIGEEKKVLLSTIIAAITNILINLILIKPLSHIGAAIASVIAEATVSGYQLFHVSKHVPLRGLLHTLKSILIPAVSMIIVMLLIKHIHMTCIIELIIASAAGIICYVILSFVCHNNTMFIIKKSINNIINKN